VIYATTLKVDLSETIADVKEITKSMNETLAACGYGEKISIGSEIELGKITVNRELTQKEIHIMEHLFEEQFKMLKVLKDCKFSVELKPYKSHKSCNQSESR
jgi:hypothetical protein